MGVERHIYVGWLNEELPFGEQAWQQVHLSGGPGNYSFYACTVGVFSSQNMRHKTDYSLGWFTRTQRDAMLDIAKTVPFVRKSYSDNCQTWMSRYLMLLAAHGDLITAEVAQTALNATLGLADSNLVPTS